MRGGAKARGVSMPLDWAEPGPRRTWIGQRAGPSLCGGGQSAEGPVSVGGGPGELDWKADKAEGRNHT